MAEASGSDPILAETGDVERELVSSIRGKLPTSPLPAQCCIFRVPVTLRESNENAYVPKIISIGPYHHGKENLKEMEKVKLWYLRFLLNRLPESLDGLVEGIRNIEQHCRECYDDEQINNLSSDQFVEMMVIDGCFIIELFRKYLGTLARDKDDPVFNMPWMFVPLPYDLLLLENQFPWTVLDTVWRLTAREEEVNGLTFSALKFFDEVMPVKFQLAERPVKNTHLLDFLRNSLLLSFTDKENPQNSLFWSITNTNVPRVSEGTGKQIPCVTELLQARVKFKRGKDDGSIYIRFSNGVMEISPILIKRGAEFLFRNLVAFEQCYPGCDDKIASYAMVLDYIIDSSKDVDFLCDKGIITTHFSRKDLANMFFSLCRNCGIARFAYVELCKKVNEYYSVRRNRWRSILRRDYFSCL